MTPLTGWWHCAAERGGGVACWLELVRRISSFKPERPVVFLATGGHELGDLGLVRALEARPGLAELAVAWLRLGANIGAADPGGTVLTASDRKLTDGAARLLHQAGEKEVTVVTAANAQRQLLVRGRNRYFHLVEDRWPGAVDVDALGRVAMAICEWAVELSASGEAARALGLRYAI
jgi:hypothetical protein